MCNLHQTAHNISTAHQVDRLSRLKVVVKVAIHRNGVGMTPSRVVSSDNQDLVPEEEELVLLEAIQQPRVRSKVEALAVVQEIVLPEAVPHGEGIVVVIVVEGIVVVSNLEASVVAGEDVFAVQEVADLYNRVERSVAVNPNTPGRRVKAFLIGRKQLSPAITAELTPVDGD